MNSEGGICVSPERHLASTSTPTISPDSSAYGLVGQLDLVVLDREEKLGGSPGCGCTRCSPGVVHPNGFSAPLGVVHGGVCRPEQLGRGLAVLPVDRRADADTDEPRDSVDVDRSDQRLAKPVCDCRHIVGVAQLPQDDGELVPAQPRCRVVVERVGVQASPDLLEHEVALVMPRGCR